MVNEELNKRIIEKVRNKIVISNLESEENMKLNKRKQVLSLLGVMTIMLVGSFITVNAATNGELVDKAKDTIKVVFIKEDGKEEEIKGNTYKDSNNHTMEKFEYENNGATYTLEVDKDNLDGSNITIEENIKDDEANITIKNNKW
mgnify:CR=1 FL=1